MSEPADDLNALANALRGLTPRQDAFDRDAVLFRSGQQSMRPGWLGPLVSIIATTTAIVLALVLLLRPVPQTVERVVYLSSPPSPQPAPASPISTPPTPVVASFPAAAESVVLLTEEPWLQPRHMRMQENLLRWGLDAMSEPTPDEPVETLSPELQEMRASLRKPLQMPPLFPFLQGEKKP